MLLSLGKDMSDRITYDSKRDKFDFLQKYWTTAGNAGAYSGRDRLFNSNK